FPALTELTNLYYVGGDGQEVMPDPLNAVNVALDHPLEVAVFNGQFPVAGAQVRFTASAGGTLNQAASPQTAITQANGIASMVWELDPNQPSQTCTAELLEAGQAVTGKYNSIRFSASLSIASQVAYDAAECADLQAAGVSTVQAALDALCRRNHAGSSGCCRT